MGVEPDSLGKTPKRHKFEPPPGSFEHSDWAHLRRMIEMPPKPDKENQQHMQPFEKSAASQASARVQGLKKKM